MNVEFWNTVLNLVERGTPVFCALVANHSHHSPGTRGAKMWVTDDEFGGTIGGGVMERDVIERGKSMLKNGVDFAHELLVHRDGNSAVASNAKRSGLFCAGEQQMVYVVARPADLECIRRLAAGDRSGFVEISQDGWRSVATKWEQTSSPISFRDGVYQEVVANPFRAAIFGAGHCGQALATVLVGLGYDVELIDPRDLPARDDVRSIRCEFSQGGASVSTPSLTHAIVMTANFPWDVEALTGLSGLDFPYIGVMGSAAKIARIRQQIPSDVNTRLTAPIGLRMTSNTPQEIAISVAAQLLEVRADLFSWTRPTLR